MSQKPKPSVASFLSWLLIGAASWILLARSLESPWLLWVVLVGSLLFPFVVGSISVRQTKFIRLDQEYKPIDPLDPEVPEVVARDAGEIESRMESLGFRIEGYYLGPILEPNFLAYSALFRNPANGDVSRSVSVVKISGKPSLAASFLTFSTFFSDGTVVVALNLTTAPIFLRMPPPVFGYYLPEIRLASSLHSTHKMIVGRFEGGRIRVDPINGDPLGYLNEREHDRLLAHLVKTGYYRRDDEAMLIRPTWKGATLMAWKLLPPFKQIRDAGQRASARKLMRKLEAGTWAPDLHA